MRWRWAVRATLVLTLAPVVMGFAPNPYPGTIHSIDLTARVMTMEDGTTYVLRPEFDTGGLRAGDKVLVEWGMYHSKLAADRIEPCTTQPACQK